MKDLVFDTIDSNIDYSVNGLKEKNGELKFKVELGRDFEIEQLSEIALLQFLFNEEDLMEEFERSFSLRMRARKTKRLLEIIDSEELDLELETEEEILDKLEELFDTSTSKVCPECTRNCCDYHCSTYGLELIIAKNYLKESKFKLEKRIEATDIIEDEYAYEFKDDSDLNVISDNFYHKDYGCSLPRRYRSNLCLFYTCANLEEEVLEELNLDISIKTFKLYLNILSWKLDGIRLEKLKNNEGILEVLD